METKYKKITCPTCKDEWLKFDSERNDLCPLCEIKRKNIEVAKAKIADCYFKNMFGKTEECTPEICPLVSKNNVQKYEEKTKKIMCLNHRKHLKEYTDSLKKVDLTNPNAIKAHAIDFFGEW